MGSRGREIEIPSPGVLSLFVHFLFARAKRKWTPTSLPVRHRAVISTSSTASGPPSPQGEGFARAAGSRPCERDIQKQGRLLPPLRGTFFRNETSPFCTTEGRFERGFSHLAVPEKRRGLALILAFFDRCGNSAPPFSATGSGAALFPLFHRFKDGVQGKGNRNPFHLAAFTACGP